MREMTTDTHLAEATVDSIINLVLTRAIERGCYQDIMGPATDAERAEIEASQERHAARMRAQGLPGW